MCEALAAVYNRRRDAPDLPHPAESPQPRLRHLEVARTCRPPSARASPRGPAGRFVGPAKAHELLRRDVWSGLKPDTTDVRRGAALKQVLRKGLKEIVVGEVPDPRAAVAPRAWNPGRLSLISSGTETAGLHQDGVGGGGRRTTPPICRRCGGCRGQGRQDRCGRPRRCGRSSASTAVLGYSGAGLVAASDAVTDLEPGERVAYGGEGTGHGEAVGAGRNLVVRCPRACPSSTPLRHAREHRHARGAVSRDRTLANRSR